MDPIAKLDSLPRLRLCRLPTPLDPMRRLSERLGLTDGPELWIKRDDLTGLAFGGNKGRKLEFCLAEARRLGADVVFTSGGNQSNHCRQTAIAAVALGFEAHLFLSGDRPPRMTGNLLPAEISGAELHFADDDPRATRQERIDRVAEQLKARGRRVYVIPGGASSPTGTMGYVEAVREIASQQDEIGGAFDWIVCATGSGGTQVGLLVGRAIVGMEARIQAFAVRPLEDVDRRRADLASACVKSAALVGADVTVGIDDVLLDDAYGGTGYDVPTDAGRAAIELLARTEGVFLDNCYTAKAMAGLLDYVRTGRFAPGQRVLFLHTGGNIALFA